MAVVLIGSLPGARAMAAGDVFVIDRSAGTRVHPEQGGALFRVDRTTGQRALVSDFGDGAQGPLGSTPAGLALADTGHVLVIDASAGEDGFGALFRVDPGTGQRTLVSDFGAGAQGPLGFRPWAIAVDGAGQLLVADLGAGTDDRGALFRVDPATGQRTVVTDFGDGSQGPLGLNPFGLAVARGGHVLVIDGAAGTSFRGALFRVDPGSGERTLVSDFGDSAQGPLGFEPVGLALESSGHVLVADPFSGTDGLGALFRVDPVTGQRALVSDFGASAQGPVGSEPVGLARASSGQVLVADVDAGTGGRGALFAVDPGTWHRVLVSDFGDSAQGVVGLDPHAVAMVVSTVPFVVDDLGTSEPLTSRLFTAPPGVSAVGVVEGVTGGGTITRPDGTVEPLSVHSPIFLGDVIETDAGARVDILFVDETEFTVRENARMEIDEYVYDDPTDPDAGPSLLRRIFEFTADVIGGDEPVDVEDTPTCCGGIRGDVESHLSRELLANPDSTLYGNAGIWVENASPVGVSTVVQIPDGTLDLALDVVFLGDQDGHLSIVLGSTTLVSLPLSPDRKGQVQHAERRVEGWPRSLETLRFVLDGPAGNGLVLTGLALPGRSTVSFEHWFKEGQGRAHFVWVATAEQLDRLVADAQAAGGVGGEPLGEHVQCYKARDSRGDICGAGSPRNEGSACETEQDCGGTEDGTSFCVSRGFQKGRHVTLTDPFESAVFELRKQESLCAPGDGGAEAAADAGGHLIGYGIAPAKGQCPPEAPLNAGHACRREEDCGGQRGATALCLAQARPGGPAGVRVENQFHPVSAPLVVDALGPDRLLVPAAADRAEPAAPPDPAVHGLDHFLCYAVRATRGGPRFQPVRGVVVTDPLTQVHALDLTRPTRLCAPAARDGGPVTHPDRHLMCYQARPVERPGPDRIEGVFVSDPFGPARLDATAHEEVCVPSAATLSP